MEFTGAITLPSGFVATYHKIISIKIDTENQQVSLDILSWGNQQAMLDGFRYDRQLASLPFSEIPSINGIVTSLKNKLLGPGGPLAGTTEIPK